MVVRHVTYCLDLMILHVIRQVPFSIRELHFKANAANSRQPFFLKGCWVYFWNFMVRQNSSIYVVGLKRCNKDCDKHVSRFQGNGRKSRENYFGKGQIIRNHSTKRHQNWLYSTFLSALVNKYK